MAAAAGTAVPPARVTLISGRDPHLRAAGHESYVVAHARAARRAGCDVHVFALGSRHLTRATDYGTLHIVGTPIRPIHSITAVLQRRRLVAAITASLAGVTGPHVLHGFVIWADAAVAAARALERRSERATAIATVWTTVEHQTAAKLASPMLRRRPIVRAGQHLQLAAMRIVARRVERRAYERCSLVLVNYESVRELLRDEYGVAARVRRTTYAAATAFEASAVHADPPRPAGLATLPDDGSPLVVSASRHDGRKGLDVLIRALACLRDAGVPVRACLLGTGMLWRDHRALVSALGLDDRVSLPGLVPEVMPYLRHANVFVLPSIEEGSGSVSVLEALQAGVPVLATEVDGMPEDITDGVEGVLVPPGDEHALASALQTMLSDPERLRRHSAAARSLYERRFSAEAAVAAAREIYGELGLASHPN